MNIASIEPIVRALLYEGYVLYPYRADSLKNRHRWTLGGLVPRAYGDAHDEAWFLQAECMLRGDRDAMLTVCVQFLHPMELKGAASSWQEAAEERVAVPNLDLAELVANSRRVPFSVPATRSTDGECERVRRPIAGTIELSAFDIGEHLFRLNICVVNETRLDDPRRMNRHEAMVYSLASAHVVISVDQGEFISLTDPPDDLKKLADICHNIGVWPILVGDPANRDTVLASPIVLADFPRIAPETALSAIFSHSGCQQQ